MITCTKPNDSPVRLERRTLIQVFPDPGKLWRAVRGFFPGSRNVGFGKDLHKVSGDFSVKEF